VSLRVVKLAIEKQSSIIQGESCIIINRCVQERVSKVLFKCHYHTNETKCHYAVRDFCSKRKPLKKKIVIMKKCCITPFSALTMNSFVFFLLFRFFLFSRLFFGSELTATIERHQQRLVYFFTHL